MSTSPQSVVDNGNALVETPSCVRCSKLITTGHAYELGGDRWHTHCFSCYKCDKPLSCDSDFLVLGTSALICSECSDSCKSCGKKIDDLAIILASSNEAYCSDCFKCCKCGEKINDLRYAKTKKGLFCISCHERLLAKRKYHEEKKRRLRKQLPTVPVPQSLPQSLENEIDSFGFTLDSDQYSSVSPSDQLRSRSISKDHDLGEDNPKSITAPVDFSKDPMIRSNSNSVIAQFLDDEYHQDQSSIPEKNSSSQLDKMLQSTLSNSEEDTLQISSSILLPTSEDSSKLNTVDHQISDRYTSPRSSYEKTPLRSNLRSPTQNNQPSKSPVTNRHAVILNDEEEDAYFNSNGIDPELMNTPKPKDHQKPNFNTPKSPGSPKSDERTLGLGISTPKSLQKFKLSSSLAIISPRADIVRTTNPIGVPYDSLEEKTLPYSVAAPPNQNHSAPDHHRRTSSGAKNISRSLSFRSKNLISNLRGKTKSVSSPGKTDKDFDTHSGWGVNTSHPAIEEAVNKQNLPQNRRRISGRGQSDSTIYSQLPLDSASNTQSHIRSQSGSNKVSMFRTPPLESMNSFNHSHKKSLSIEGNAHSAIEENITGYGDENDEFTPIAKEFFEKDLTSVSLQLRKLNMEVKELQQTKSQLSNDIEILKSMKEKLYVEVEELRNSRKDLQSSITSQESLPEAAYYADANGNSPIKNQTTSTSNGAIARPRFWKLFGNGNGNVKQINGSSSKPVEISAPMLQNPNEFDDLKLLPIQNSESNESASQNSGMQNTDGHNLYGSSLVSRCAYEQRPIPVIVTSCINYIESDLEFLKTEGLYRKSGSQSLIEQFEKMFADEETVDLKRLNADIHAVASVLKRYLRKLPNPVFCYQSYQALVNLVRDNNLLIELPLVKNARNDSFYMIVLEKLVNTLKTLPVEHLRLLKLLCTHLEHVMQYQEDNLMNLNNLALVFAPGLIKDYTGKKDIVDMKERNYLIGFVFQNYRDIFTSL